GRGIERFAPCGFILSRPGFARRATEAALPHGSAEFDGIATDRPTPLCARRIFGWRCGLRGWLARGRRNLAGRIRRLRWRCRRYQRRRLRPEYKKATRRDGRSGKPGGGRGQRG